MTENHNDIATSLRIFFEKYRDEIDMQGFSTFPVNSCQGASLLLGMMLQERSPSSQIDYVKGEDKNSFCHYWLEVDGLVFDITADQFKDVGRTIYGETSQPLLARFPMLTRTTISEELLVSDITTQTYNNTMKVNLDLHLRSYDSI